MTNPSLKGVLVLWVRWFIGRFRANRKLFRRWWRSKPILDFLYWRLLRRRLGRECRELLKGKSFASAPTDVRRALALLRPQPIAQSLIRVGSGSDGGYLLPESAKNITALFSPGVGYEASFEAHFASRGVRCFLIDPTVDAAPVNIPNLEFHKLRLGTSSGSGSVSLEDWVSQYFGQSGANLGLQMDIEGGEYDVLASVRTETLSRFSFMIIEFHSLHRLIDANFRDRFEEIMEKVGKHHVIVHAHANNALPPVRWKNVKLWPLVEIVAVGKDLVTVREGRAKIPHPLDSKNIPIRRDWPFRVP